MQQIVQMVDFRKKPGEIIDKIYYQKNTFIIQRNKKKMAVLMPIDIYEALFPEEDIEMYSNKRIKEFEREDVLAE